MENNRPSKTYPDLSANQEKILLCIEQSVATTGYPPTVREMCDAVGLHSTSTVHSHLTQLEKKGYIRRDPTKPRAIEITDPLFTGAMSARADAGDLSAVPASEQEAWETNTASVPVVGQVAAGQPILAVQNIEGYYPIPSEYLPQGETFALRVHGSSMINAGIMDGDLIFVNRCNTAENGEIVVALVDDSATVKRFYKEKGHIRLQPENDEMEPIIVPDCQILGKVFAVFRYMKRF